MELLVAFVIVLYLLPIACLCSLSFFDKLLLSARCLHILLCFTFVNILLLLFLLLSIVGPRVNELSAFCCRLRCEILCVFLAVLV